MQEIYSIPLATIAIILLFSRLFDAIQDPIIGYYSNKMESKKWVSFSTIICALTIIILFTTKFSYWLLFAILLISYSSFSIFTIQYFAQGNKSEYITMREIFRLLFSVIIVALPDLLVAFNIERNDAYRYISYVILLLTIIANIIFLKFKPEPTEKINISFKLTNNFIGFNAILLFTNIASFIPSAIVLYYIDYIIGAEKITGVFILIYLLSGAIFTKFWERLGHSISIIKAWIIAHIIAVVTFIWAYFLSEGDVYQFATVCFLSGMAFGADAIFPYSLAFRHKEIESKMNMAIVSFNTKFALTVATFIGLFFIGNGDDIAVAKISFIYALLPCILKFLSTYLIYCYKDKINND